MCIDAQYFEDRMDDLFDSDMLSCVSDVKVKEMAEVGKNFARQKLQTCFVRWNQKIR